MPTTIIVFLFGDLGDTILTVPAIRALRLRFPESRILLLSKSSTGEFVAALGLVDEVIVVDKHVFDRTSSLLQPRAWLSLLRLTRRLRVAHVDTLVLFHHLVTRWGTLKFALLALATGASTRAGLDNGRGWFLTDRVIDAGFGARHEAEYWLEVAALLDAHGDLTLEAPIADSDRRVATELLETAVSDSRVLVAIHAGTGVYGPGRRWPADKFAETMSLIAKRHPITCLVVGTQSEATESRQLLALLPPESIDLVGRTSTGELGAVLARCSLLIANDGGVAHLASAVGTPVISIFGPSNDRAWRPLTARVIAVDLPCRPCFYRDHERGLPNGCATRECLHLVTPLAVARAAVESLRNLALVG